MSDPIHNYLDERLAEALKTSKYIEALNAKKRLLQEEFDRSCTFSSDGGTFVVNAVLLLALGLSMSRDPCIVLDTNGRPVKIGDPEAFRQTAAGRYLDAMHRLYESTEALKKQRTVEKLFED